MVAIYLMLIVIYITLHIIFIVFLISVSLNINQQLQQSILQCVCVSMMIYQKNDQLFKQ